MIGTTLDKYEVLQKLGEGGMATVYLGRHATLGREVAIKVLHPHLSSSARNRKRFAAEARAIERLHHPNILEIHDYSGIDASDCYIVTEYVHGTTLAALVRDRGRLPSELVARIGIALARALAYAHLTGILHRDIKPENVMVRPDGVVKLMDFGIARFLDESHVTMTGALVGSPAFMSPEQATEGTLDARSDIFSLGTLLFHLVTGHLPFSGSNPSVILRNVIEGRRPSVLELAPAASARLADAIERAMSQRPEDRFDRADDLVEALSASLAEVGIPPASDSFSLTSYLADPETWERGLDRHLRDNLPSLGRIALDRGDSLDALRLFNRLLSIDEGNAEVLALVQNLHSAPPRPARPWRVRVAALALVAAAGVAALAWWAPDPGPAAPARSSVAGERASVAVAPSPATPPPFAPASSSVSAPVPPPAAAALASAPPTVATRPAATVAPTLPPSLPTEPARVRFVSEWPATVYKGDVPLGEIRRSEPFLLAPGLHRLVAKGDAIVPLAFDLEVASGQELERVLSLEPRPARVRFDATWDANCVASVDDVDIGPLAGLSSVQGEGATWRILEVRAPQQPHVVGVRCGGSTTTRRWERFTRTDVVFPSRQ